MVQLRVGSATDTGRVRDLNEDSLLVTDRLFAVADGMGGHAAGEVASLIAVETLKANADETAESIVEAIKQANRAVLTRSEEDPETRGMGTTLSVVALAASDQIVVANVGDSRVYRLHQGELEQVSEDHSLVQDLVREGRITAAEARVHPNRNVVTRTIGNDPSVDVDHWIVDPAAGDRYLVCSDGLTDEVEDHAIARVLHTVKDPDEAARDLVALANQAGGRDNITVLVVDVVDDGGRSAAASAALAKEPSRTKAEPAVRERTIERGPGGGPPTAAIPAMSKPKRFTWRVALFVLAVVLVFVGAFGGTIWFARNTYSVRAVDDAITIFRGRELLWFEPTIEDRTDLELDDVQASRRDEVTDGREFSSRAEAEDYLENITTTTTSTTTTTTTTSTTVAPPAPTTTAAPPPP